MPAMNEHVDISAIETALPEATRYASTRGMALRGVYLSRYDVDEFIHSLPLHLDKDIYRRNLLDSAIGQEVEGVRLAVADFAPAGEPVFLFGDDDVVPISELLPPRASTEGDTL